MNGYRLGRFAALGHRVSGIALAIFLPVHFLVLGLALDGDGALDGIVAFGRLPWVRAAEWVLLVLLTTHGSFGLRILVIERWPKQGPDSLRTRWILPAIIAALAVASLYILLSD